MAVLKDKYIVGHVPRKISFLCSVKRGGAIRYIVTGDHCYSHDLPQGGMEVPCKLVFSGTEQDVNRVQTYLEECNKKVVLMPSSYESISHVEEGHTKSLVIKQEPLDNFSSSTVSIPQSGSSIRIKDDEKCGPPAKCLKYDRDGSKFCNTKRCIWYLD